MTNLWPSLCKRAYYRCDKKRIFLYLSVNIYSQLTCWRKKKLFHSVRNCTVISEALTGCLVQTWADLLLRKFLRRTYSN